MRLWSIHPKYLDTKGLVALWREGLLAKAVLEGKTKGYKNHPQLERFKAHKNPIKAIRVYLFHVHKESVARGFNFKKSPVLEEVIESISVSRGQLKYEHLHLQKKLMKRDRKKFAENSKAKKIISHPLMRTVNGSIEDWEKI